MTHGQRLRPARGALFRGQFGDQRFLVAASTRTEALERFLTQGILVDWVEKA